MSLALSLNVDVFARLQSADRGGRSMQATLDDLIEDVFAMSPDDLAAFVERCRAGAVVAKSRSHRSDTNVELPLSLFDRVLRIAQTEAAAIGLPLRSANKSAVLESAINAALDAAERPICKRNHGKCEPIARKEAA